MDDLREALIRTDGKGLREALSRSRRRALGSERPEDRRWVWCHDWDAEREYVAGDLVFHAGSSWRALLDSTGSEPPSPFWELVARKGDKGERGLSGFPGPSGTQGPPGPGSDLTIEDEGVAQGIATTMDFVGPGVTAVVAGGTATITIPGGGGSAMRFATFVKWEI